MMSTSQGLTKVSMILSADDAQECNFIFYEAKYQTFLGLVVVIKKGLT